VERCRRLNIFDAYSDILSHFHQLIPKAILTLSEPGNLPTNALPPSRASRPPVRRRDRAGPPVIGENSRSPLIALTPGRQGATPGTTRPERRPMTALETVPAVEHRCEALTISDIPPYRCTTSATDARQGREVCTNHARSLRVRWFDADD
jgi:hypothetical protein